MAMTAPFIMLSLGGIRRGLLGSLCPQKVKDTDVM